MGGALPGCRGELWAHGVQLCCNISWATPMANPCRHATEFADRVVIPFLPACIWPGLCSASAFHGNRDSGPGGGANDRDRRATQLCAYRQRWSEVLGLERLWSIRQQLHKLVEMQYRVGIAWVKFVGTQPVVLMPSKRELTTVEAAHFLNVSRPFVVKEISAGRLPHRMVGTHRRVLFEDLLAYARTMREQQAQALERMAENARKLGLDY